MFKKVSTSMDFLTREKEVLKFWKENEIFKAVTTTPAGVLGKDYGRLKEGVNADIAVFEYCNNGFDMPDRWGNNINYEKGYKCVMTMVNGQIMYRI